MSLKKWNVKKHVKNVHGIKNFPNANIKIANIDPQNIRHPPCSIHSSDYRSNQEQQHDVIQHYQSKYQPSQEEHQYNKQNIRHPPCPIHSSEYRSNQEQQHDVIPHYQSKYEPSQEKHQYGKRFKDVSTQYSENDINHFTIPLDKTNTADEIIQKKEAQLFEYDSNTYGGKSVENCKKRKPVVINSKGVFILE